jgi:putative ABC transport system permease protein
MFKNMIVVALRSLRKQIGFTALNIFGLFLGLLTCGLIGFYVFDEINFDRFNDNIERIYRVNTVIKNGATVTTRAIASPAIAGAMLSSFPEVEKTVRLFPGGGQIFRNGKEFVTENKTVYCDADFFQIFTLPMVYGNPETALKDPNTVVITESAAKRYFNKTDVIGESLVILGDSNNFITHTVTGVIKDMPKQSHFHFDFFLTMADLQYGEIKNFAVILPFNTYLLLKPNQDYKTLEKKFHKFVLDNFDLESEAEKAGDYYKLTLMPLKEIHLNSNFTDELESNGNKQYVEIFGIVALFIILVAGINFVNLSTARSSERAREIGVRKILGSPQKYLVGQFLFESIIITALASILAFIGGWLLLPFFNQITGKELAVTSQFLFWLIPTFLIVILLTGTLAGLYPAFLLASFKPVNVLRGKVFIGIKKSYFRNSLVVLQFSVSIFLIVGSLVVYKQLQFIQSKDLGFTRNQVLVIQNMNALSDNDARLLKYNVMSYSGVKVAALSSFLPTGSRRWTNWISTRTDGIQTQFWPVDIDYIKTLGIKVSNGRDFSKSLPTDSSAIILNETAVKMLNISGDPLNQTIYKNDLNKEFHIIGVVKDFNFSSLRENVTPVALLLMSPTLKKYEGDSPDNLCIKVSAMTLPKLLPMLEKKWKSFSPKQQFSYYFMDDEFDSLYKSETRLGRVFLIFTILAIFVACLGLFGLSNYAAVKRSKEISIRKVLGASIPEIIKLLSLSFINLILISILISSPIAWYFMRKWLQDFAFRVDINWQVFLFAGIISLLIAFITIFFQSLKASVQNPIKSLKED